MKLKIVYGKAGSGKSTYIFNNVKERIKYGEKVFIITPEQFSFTAEKKLMDTIDEKSVFNAEVITFNRMAYRVINNVGGRVKTNLSACGKAMMIYSILGKYKKDLTFLGKSDENIDIMINAITEFKKHMISIEDLKNQIENTDDTYLKLKLQDMLIVYEEFENKIIENYIDENEVLTILSEKLDEVTDYNNSNIFIDEFAGFTNQEYEVMKKLIKKAKEVTISICIQNLDLNTNPDIDIFYSNKLTLNKLINLAKELGCDIEYHNLEKLYRFKNSELYHLEENLYSIPYKIYNKENKNIKLFLANNQYSEIEHVAENIVHLVRNEKMRYKDISIITKNIDSYSSLVKAIFNKYKIPVFIDEKKDLSQNIVVKYILSILDIFNKNWSYESVFNYLKTGFIDIEKDEIYKLENYCIKWGIKANKWYKKDWNFGKTEDNKEEIERYNELRKNIIFPLIELKEELRKSENAKKMTKILYEFLIKMKIDEKLEAKIKKLENLELLDIANEYNTSWNIIMQVLDEIVLVFGDEKITIDKYTEILKVGLRNSGLGKIPGTQDQVIIGDVDRSRSHKVQAIFIIGLNDGQFPSVNKDEGFLNDQDREFLKQNGIELAKGTIDRLYEDNFNIYKAFTTSENRLYLSYASSNSEGKSLRPSILVSRIKKIYPELVEESDIINDKKIIGTKETTFDNLLENLNKLRNGEEIEDIWYDIFEYYNNDNIWKEKLNKSIKGFSYTNMPDKIEKDLTEKLYGKVLKTSVSRLEKYRSCPFSFYLKYGLKLKEKQEFKIQAVDTGSFMHDVIDEFFTMVREKKIKPKEISEEELKEIVNDIIDEKLQLSKNYIFTSTPKFKVLTNRLKRVISKSIRYIIEGLKNTDFEVVGNEVEFKEGAKYEPIRLNLDNGKIVEITGKIDRIDLAQNADGKFIRIIDYKSSVKNIDLNEVVAGLQLQLLTYLDATCKIEDVMPAGVLYYNLIDPIIKSNKSMSEEEIEKEIKKKFKMQGLILADVNVVKMMDKKLEKGTSDTIPVYLDKDGNISKSKSNAINKEQFEILQEYIKKTIVEISNEILSGSIDLKPYYNVKNKKTPCEYCEYKQICSFNRGFCNNDYRYIYNMDKELILDMIAKGE